MRNLVHSLGRHPALRSLVAVPLLGACSGGSGSAMGAPDPTASSSQAIESGHYINDPADAVSSVFPRSAVNIKMNAGGMLETSCTGVLIGANKVLTAAHCTYPDTPSTNELTVTFYPTTAGAGALPLASTSQVVQQTDVVIPPYVTCSPERTDPDPTCFSNGVYADMAVLTLPTPVTSPWKPAYLAPKGAVASLVAAKKAKASWAVGTGYMNYVEPYCQGTSNALLPPSVTNPQRMMEWVPVASFSNGGATGIITNDVYTDLGDSGGPLYQYAGIGDNLALLGVVSLFVRACNIFEGNAHYNRYSDVTEPSNYDWLVSNGATEMPTTGSFGAGL